MAIVKAIRQCDILYPEQSLCDMLFSTLEQEDVYYVERIAEVRVITQEGNTLKDVRTRSKLIRIAKIRIAKSGCHKEERQQTGESFSPTLLGNFYYITMLRDPVSRYLSEWKHVQRGATWKTSLHMCDGRSPTPDELPTCYEGDDWSGVSLQEFMDCSYNLANNRQVRMLADLSLVGCYNLTFMNESERNIILLQSAKNNLKNMAFFGLTEFQRKTQYLFERTFNLKFISPFTQFNVTRASNVDIGEDVRQRIEELNFLDVQLYEYAKDLFLQRFQYSKQEEHQKNRLKRREERRLLREQRAHQWPREEAAEVAITEDYNSQVARW
ncbi:heparan-sulfate 6-O-sulfotransferase 3 [Egretta garzetta]|uniref:heparan-sulfate 6-O-sulfotransferase 3 n=1 Tax=Egretta garzetta TaxID=188379 RepID=UPI00051F0CEE|nr:heparan-sulfate 6-O-sulfotransferase 3 [Egretta garzetta]